MDRFQARSRLAFIPEKQTFFEVIINNTSQGVLDPDIPLNPLSDQTLLGLSATITYSVPEPAGIALLAIGSVVVLCVPHFQFGKALRQRVLNPTHD
jgi:hypothetical protein